MSTSGRHDESHVAASDSSRVEMSFEQLKREAAALERQLEEKLSRYQQVRLRDGLSTMSWAKRFLGRFSNPSFASKFIVGTKASTEQSLGCPGKGRRGIVVLVGRGGRFAT